jgi:hypothetical protein
MNKIDAKIKKIGNILDTEQHSQSIAIPNYQRPYRWQEENTRQLLQDIYESWKNGKSAYRVGSLIFHKESEETLNIVDGQQRITTILLILKVLGSETGKALCSNLSYNHIESRNRIIDNYIFITSWINQNILNEKNDFSKYITQYCEFVEIIVEDLSEAFQMFDSQNGRGKELETYNLLKAYHIRAMEMETHETKIECDRKWESATRYKQIDIYGKENHSVSDILRQVFNEQLYRTRVWSRKEDAYDFNKKKISEFKGFKLDKHLDIEYPFQNKELLQHVLYNYFQKLGVEVKGIKGRFKNSTFKNVNPFVLITQNIINGKPFFEYIETYVEIYKQLFEPQRDEMMLKEFKVFFATRCAYKGSHRDGDKYLKELYKSLIFMMFDKFGEEGLLKYYKTLFVLVYRERLIKKQVKYAAVAQYPATKRLFSIIEQSNSFLELLPLEKMATEIVICYKEVPEIIEFFINYGVPFNQSEKSVDLSKYQILN